MPLRSAIYKQPKVAIRLWRNRIPVAPLPILPRAHSEGKADDASLSAAGKAGLAHTRKRDAPVG